MQSPKCGQPLALVMLVGFAFGLCACAQKLSEPRIIATHTHQGLAPAAALTFTVNSPAGVPLLIEAGQSNGDLRIEFDPEGVASSMEYSSAWRREAGELLYLESARAVSGTVRVISEPTNKPATPVVVTVSELRPVHAADRKRNDAFRLLTQAAQLNASSNVLADRQFELLQAAQHLFGSIGEQRWQGLSQLAIAHLQVNHVGDWPDAIQRAKHASRLFRRLGLGALVAQADMLEGCASMELGLTLPEGRNAQRTLAVAREKLQAAMQQHERLGRTFDAAIVANRLGVFHYYRRDPLQARINYDRARTLFAQQGELGALHMVLQNLALLDTEAGDFRTAAERYEQILSQWPSGAERHGYADTLHNSALAQTHLGNIEVALERHLASRELLSGQGDRSGEARALHGIGTALLHIGAPDRALPLLETALQIRRELRNRQQLFASLKVTGTIYRELGDPERALNRHREALSLAQAPLAKLLVEAEMARDLEMLGQVDQAYTLLQEALSHAELHDHPLIAPINIQLDYLAVIAGHQVATRLAALRTAVRTLRADGEPFAALRSRTALAMAELSAGEWQAAASTAAIALGDARGYRRNFASFALRTRLASIERDALETLVDALMFQWKASGQPAHQRQLLAHETLTAIDTVRAGLTVDLQHEHLQRRGLAERRTQAQLMHEQISGKWFRAQQLLDRAEPPLKEIHRLYAEAGVLQTRSDLLQRTVGPGSAGQSPDRALTAAFLREPALRDGEVGVAYFLGSRASWAWRIDANGLEAVQLRDRDIIRSAAAELTDAARRSGDDSAWRAAASTLAALVIHPLGIQRTGLSSVRIVADDVLQSVPFVLLSTSPSAPPLVEVADVFFASTLAPVQVMEREHAKGESGHRVLVVADPIYSRSDIRIGGQSQHLTTQSQDELPRLVGSAREAQAIKQLAPANVTLLLGDQSSLPWFSKQAHSSFDILHFATHGRTLPGAQDAVGLLLSTVDVAGNRIPGWLRPDDVLGLNLSSRIVFLSACDSATSQRIPFQGAVGLKEAFIAAGAEHVVASQWPVADGSAAYLVRAFYDDVMIEGRPPAAALRASQREMLRTRWNHPFFWAGLGVTVADSRSGSMELILRKKRDKSQRDDRSRNDSTDWPGGDLENHPWNMPVAAPEEWSLRFARRP